MRYPLKLEQDGFRGTLLDIDLPLVLQTLNNAQRDGILYLCDDLMRPLAQIFCLKGKIVSASYKNLWNEMAIYQIIQKSLAIKFAFLPTKKAPSPIHRICTLICIFINVKLIVNIHTKNLRSGQSIGSDSDSDSENEGGVVDGESNVDLSGYSRQERDRAHSVFNHCTTVVSTVL